MSRDSLDRTIRSTIADELKRLPEDSYGVVTEIETSGAHASVRFGPPGTLGIPGWSVQAHLRPHLVVGDQVKTWRTRGPGGGSQEIVAITGRSLAPVNAPYLDIRDYGAKLGESDSTAALVAAHADAAAGKGILWIPQGEWSFPSLTGLPAGCVMRGAGKMQTKLMLPDGVWLFDIPVGVLYMEVTDLWTTGGAGLMRQTYTGNNAQNGWLFRDVYIYQYTGIGIGTLSVDNPYIRIERCDFNGDIDTSIGVAFVEDGAGMVVRDCTFRRNRYSMKLALSGLSTSIEENTFIRGGIATPPRHDIWLVPSDGNNGRCRILNNKLGPEGMHDGARRILVADEDEGSGDDFLTRFHSEDPSTATSVAVLLDNNIIGSTGVVTTPPIYTTTPHLYRWVIGATQLIGTMPTMFVEYLEPELVDWYDASNLMGPLMNTSGVDRLPVIPTNAPGAWTIHDPLGQYDAMPRAYARGLLQPELLELMSRDEFTSFVSTNLTRTTDQTDAYGFAKACLYVSNTGITGAGIGHSNDLTPVPGVPIWIEFDAKRAATDSADYLTIKVTDLDTSERIFQRIVVLHEGWRRYRFHYTPATDNDQQLQFEVEDAETGVMLFHPCWYQCAEPVDSMYVYGVGSPEGVVKGLLGALYHDISNAELYVKRGAVNGNSNWKKITRAA